MRGYPVLDTAGDCLAEVEDRVVAVEGQGRNPGTDMDRAAVAAVVAAVGIQVQAVASDIRPVGDSLQVGSGGSPAARLRLRFAAGIEDQSERSLKGKRRRNIENGAIFAFSHSGSV